jgi:hypothetical protein
VTTAFLGAKQEGLAIVNFLNKLTVSCKEAVRIPIFWVIFKLDSYFFILINRLFPVIRSDCPFYAET